MKKILLSITTICCSLISFGQTNTFPSSGNVGIGITSPTESLDINGKLRISNTQIWDNEINRYNNDNLYIGYRNTANTILQLNSGNVGVGTSSPLQKFVVSNNGNEGLEVYLGQPSGVVGLQSYNRQSSSYSKMQFDASSFGFMNGSLGIGTLLPQFPLDVRGIVKWGDENGKYIYSGEDGSGAFFEQVGTNSINSRLRLQSSKLSNQSDYAQFYVDAEHGFSFMTIGAGNGNVGIGTSTPDYKLDVTGEGRIASAIITNSNSPFASSSVLYSQSGFHNMFGVDGTWTAKYFGMKTDGSFLVMGGNVGIGTTTPDEKLTVKGKIHAEEVRVDLAVPAPDYVFEKDYRLTPLSEIQTYIKENKHLPEVPSAKEMEKNGVNLSEMNMLLLKKVEELTLHLINTNLKVEELEKENIEIKNALNQKM